MSSVKQIQAVARDRVGKGAARAVRRQGQVPAVIYGGGEPAAPIALDFNQTKQMIFAGHFLTTIFEIDVDGQKTRAIPRDYQLDPVKDFRFTSTFCAWPRANPSRSRCRSTSSARKPRRA